MAVPTWGYSQSLRMGRSRSICPGLRQAQSPSEMTRSRGRSGFSATFWRNGPWPGLRRLETFVTKSCDSMATPRRDRMKSCIWMGQRRLQHGLMLNDGLFMALLQVAAILPQVNWTPANSAHSLLAMPAVMRLGSHPPDGTCCTMLHIWFSCKHLAWMPLRSRFGGVALRKVARAGWLPRNSNA